jgi:hypothetical protein
MSKDRQNLVKGIIYLIRDVFNYYELLEIKQFIEEIIENKKQEGYDNE